MIVVQNATAYEHDHYGLHHRDFASADDPDFKFIVEVMNLKPWLSKEENRKRFLTALFSPKIHGLFLLGRLYANYVGSPLYRRLMSFGWLLVVVAAVALSGMWLEFGFFVFCITVPYSMSAMAQFFTEHFWTEKRKPGQSARQHHDNKLLNRYLATRCPMRACGASAERFLGYGGGYDCSSSTFRSGWGSSLLTYPFTAVTTSARCTRAGRTPSTRSTAWPRKPDAPPVRSPAASA